MREGECEVWGKFCDSVKFSEAKAVVVEGKNLLCRD